MYGWISARAIIFLRGVDNQRDDDDDDDDDDERRARA